MKFGFILLAAMLLAACASYSGAGLKPDEAQLADVEAVMGVPAMRWDNADGSSQLAYPRGPIGLHTFMVRIRPDGRLDSITNVLDEAGFARIRPGMNKDEVLRVLGPPDPSRSVYFERRDELVWDWRFCEMRGTPGHFLVLFDATAGTVRSTLEQSELFEQPRQPLPCNR